MSKLYSKTFYDKASRALKDHFDTCKKIDDEMTDMFNAGMYSATYLQHISYENKQKKSNDAINTANLLQKIRDDFEAEAKKSFALDGIVNPFIKDTLNSGIKLTMEEFKEIANRPNIKPIDLRLIRDKAAEQGITVEIPNATKATEYFDKFIQNAVFSLDNSSMPIKPYNSIEAMEKSARGFMDLTDNMGIDVYKTPQSIEEQIAHEMRINNQNKDNELGAETERVMERSFMEGLFGHEIEEKPIDAELTETQREYAKKYSVMNGRNGEITEIEIEWLNSKDYEEFRAKQEQEQEEKDIDGKNEE